MASSADATRLPTATTRDEGEALWSVGALVLVKTGSEQTTAGAMETPPPAAPDVPALVALGRAFGLAILGPLPS